LRQARKAGKVAVMRLASLRHLLSAVGFFALCAMLGGCPEKGGAPADNKTTAEPERQEPDEEGKALGEAKKPAAAPAEEKKPDEAKDEGGW
jgi:hypothetical protein